jgi:hypothetical protein
MSRRPCAVSGPRRASASSPPGWRRWWLGLVLLPLLGGLALRHGSDADTRRTVKLLDVKQASVKPVDELPVAAPMRRQVAAALNRPMRASDVEARAPSEASTLRGVVVDALGGVITGARVDVAPPGETVPFASVHTDSQGAFGVVVPAGIFDVSANAEAYSRAVQRVQAPLVSVRLVLTPAASVQGRVVAASSGAPIAGARVTAASSSESGDVPRQVHSREDGSFTLEALSPGRYLLSAVALPWRASDVQIQVGFGQALTSIVLRAQPAITLHGLVQLGDEPCLRGQVTLRGPVSMSRSTGPRGEVQLEGLLPGRYDAGIRCSALETTNPTGDASEHVPAPIGSDDVIEVGAEPLERVWRLEPPSPDESASGASATIRVLLESGHEAVTALLLGSDGQAIRGSRDAGYTTFSGLELGDYEVYLQQVPRERRRVRVTKPGETIEVRVSVPRATATISGRVIDERHDPVPDVWVRASAGSGPHLGDTLGAPVLTNEAGAFELTDLFATTHTVVAEGTLGEVRVDGVEAGARDLLLRLTEYGSLSGVVLDSAGQRVERGTITYRRDEQQELGTVLVVEGEWSLPWTAPGVYRLFAATSLGAGSRKVELMPGGDVRVELSVERENGPRLLDVLSEGLTR